MGLSNHQPGLLPNQKNHQPSLPVDLMKSMASLETSDQSAGSNFTSPFFTRARISLSFSPGGGKDDVGCFFFALEIPHLLKLGTTNSEVANHIKYISNNGKYKSCHFHP
jgi:hypothetical protein